MLRPVIGPIVFEPLFMPRVWGGRALAEHFGKTLPDGVPIGESWELVDRDDEQSVVAFGPLAGTSLRELWDERRDVIFGGRGERSSSDRFPIVVKLLDATQTLSIQVHPPPNVAAELGGEPKTEMWALLDTAPGAQLLAGLRAGVTRESFAAALENGEDVSELLHRIEVSRGDVLSIPSGRVHAVGAGCVLAEVQQNSDTTYRVYDFGRPGLDGAPRELHVEEAMRSIDWADAEPALIEPDSELLVRNELFTTSRVKLDDVRPPASEGECAVVLCIGGTVRCGDEDFTPGQLFIAPADSPDLALAPIGGPAEVLIVELPD